MAEPIFSYFRSFSTMSFARSFTSYFKTSQLSQRAYAKLAGVQPPAMKEYLTVTSIIGADGYKFPATILFKEAKKTGVLSPAIMKKLVIPNNVLVYSTASGWWSIVLDKKWLGDYFKKNHRGGCLIRDRATVHCNVASSFLLEKKGIEQIFIPTGLTGTYHPLDIGVNYHFKCYLKKSYHEWRDRRTKVTKKGYLKKPDRQDSINFVSSAWEQITVFTVINAFSATKITPEPLFIYLFI